MDRRRHRFLRRTVATFALGIAACAGAQESAPIDKPGALLMTPDQQLLENQALRIFRSPSFQSRMRETEALFAADMQDRSPDGQKTLRAANAAIAFMSLQYVADGDPQRPKIMWDSQAEYRLAGKLVPRAAYGFDNPDNIYRIVPIDGQSRYEIVGNRGPRAPAQETFFLYSSIPGDGLGPVDGPIGGLLDKDIVSGADGAFTITIDGDPANDRPNHIQSKPGAKLLLIRDTLSDWGGQSPNALQVRRIGGPAVRPPRSDGEIADEALALSPKLIAFWLKYGDDNIYDRPVNTVPPPNARGGGWGFTANGFFDLKDDEVLVMTVDAKGARYLAAQLTDPWATALEYVRHTSSLNNSQARPNADGSYSFVIAAKDPGVRNWLDSEGLHTGAICIRWQALPAGTNSDRVIRDVRVVKRAALGTALPKGALMASPEERRGQLRDRERDYVRRF